MGWIAELGAANDSLEWWSSRLSERNTWLDSLYHRICYLKLGISAVTGDDPVVLVVAEHPSVLRSLATHPAIADRDCTTALAWLLLERTRSALRLAATWAYEVLDGALAIAAARWTQRRRPILPRREGRSLVVLHTCVDETYFGDDGVPSDRYFPGLAGELRGRGHQVITLPWLSQIKRSRRKAFQWLRQRPDEHVIPQDFYTILDYLWAATVTLRQVTLARGRHEFQELDISGLVSETRWSQAGERGLANFVLYYRLIKKWSALEFEPDVFIDTFENMVAEKPQVMALRKLMPEVMTVGFQHYPSLHPLMLCLFSSPEECEFAPHPDVIVCNSPMTLAQLEFAGFPPSKLRVGPSLRYAHLARLDTKREPEANKVLVVFSLDTIASAELMHKLIKAFPRDEGIEFWLKLHPMMKRKQADQLASHSEMPAHMKRVDGPMGDWLRRAASVMTVATSSALEVALSGVPLVLVGRDSDFDQNVMDWFTEFGKPVHELGALRAAVQESLSLSPERRLALDEWALRTRDECVSPVSASTLGAFVDPAEPHAE